MTDERQGPPEWVVIARCVTKNGSSCQMKVSFNEPPEDAVRAEVQTACVDYFMKCFPDESFATASAILPYLPGEDGDEEEEGEFVPTEETIVRRPR